MFFGKTGSHKLHTSVGVRMNTVEKSEDISEDSDVSDYDDNYVNIEFLKESYHNFYMYEGHKYNFIKVSTISYKLMKSCIRTFKKFYEECAGQKHNEEKISYRELNKSDEFRFDSNLYESNIHPILRFIHKVNIVPSGWIEFDYDNTNVVSINIGHHINMIIYRITLSNHMNMIV